MSSRAPTTAEQWWPLVSFLLIVLVTGLGLWIGAMIGYASAKNGNDPPLGFCKVYVCLEDK